MDTIIWALVVLVVALTIAAAVAGAIAFAFRHAYILLPMKFFSNLYNNYQEKKSGKNEKK